MSTPYTYQKQKSESDKYERRVYKFYEHAFGFEIKKAGIEGEKKMGIDSLWKEVKTGFVYSVEFKHDTIAKANSNNVFIETISIGNQPDSPGWAYKSCAQRLVYFVVNTRKIYHAEMLEIKRMTPEWERDYREVSVQNNGYLTYGIPVPIREFEKYSFRLDLLPLKYLSTISSY